MLELNDLIVGVALHALAVANSLISSLDAASMPNGLNPGDLVVGTAVGGAVGGGAVYGGGGGDRGFVYAGLPNRVRDSPTDDGTVVDSFPGGNRIRYDGVVRDANGNITHYHTNSPGRPPGYIPAGDTHATPPVNPPRPSIIIPLDSGLGQPRSTAAHAHAGRG